MSVEQGIRKESLYIKRPNMRWTLFRYTGDLKSRRGVGCNRVALNNIALKCCDRFAGALYLFYDMPCMPERLR